MKNLKDAKTNILPSTTRGGKELPSSFALDSPSIISRLATPKSTTAINSDMLHVIDDATSAMHDKTTSVRDTTLLLGEFLDEQLARARENEIIENDNIDESDDEGSPNKYELPIVPDRSDLKKLLAKLKQKTLNARMKYDPKFATSPIFVTDKDYEFSVDPELITFVEYDPFYG